MYQSGINYCSINAISSEIEKLELVGYFVASGFKG